MMKNFSVLNTNVEILNYNGFKTIKKIYKPNINLDIKIDELNNMLLKYINLIKSAEINFPKVIETKVTNANIVYFCEYKGKNILELFSYKDFISGNADLILDQIFNILRRSIKNNLYFDPHPKNFTYQNSKVYYVDFCPPLIPEYIKKRVEYDRKHQNIVIKNFEYFSPKNLFFHFCGDFIDVFRKEDYNLIINRIYNLLLSKKIIDKIEFDEFLMKCTIIRNLEDSRLEKKVYLF